ncbi:MAG: thioesterase [Pirellulaceae bacterium]|nr:MAG: thioesterase [Pirellulaceae bacterium]
MTYRPWIEAGYRCVIQLPVQWGDQDAMGHVNNTVPLRWFESARIAYLEQSGVASALAGEGLGPILASLQCDYRRQVRYPDQVWVGARVVALGNSSFRMQHAAWSQQQQALVTEGSSILVVFDYRAQRPQRVPPSVRQLLEHFEGRSLEPASS